MKGTKFTTPSARSCSGCSRAGVGVHHGHAAALPPAGGTPSPNRAAPSHLWHRHARRRINVPIHTVVLTQLHGSSTDQDAPLALPRVPPDRVSAGRAGFDTEGMVVALAPEHEIENQLAGVSRRRSKKQRRVKKSSRLKASSAGTSRLRAPHREAAGEADAAHAHHPFHGAVGGVARRRCLGQRAYAHRCFGPNPRGEDRS